ncbi:hypothetical protein HHI36_006689 [Cryptolaemus montrouzieri]|uniref:Uncharacterized protein n=1 Tax=Cryptolaemus montrouzieri TaxID=559131 RepID=A0ABD2NZ77_9CUCU
MMEIKPHEDFRLFLTMDPKNGEISRAMRNRGVEIYILNDYETTSKNEFDWKSMIQINNLQSRKHIRVLLHMHEFLNDLILGEKPTVNELLQSAILISQQIRYGTEDSQAFLTSLIEVYYKTRSAIEFNSNDVYEVVSAKLKSLLSSSHYIDVHTEIDWFNENCTVRTDCWEISSEIQKFKQQSSLIHSILKGDVVVENENVLEYLLVMFYSASTKNDFNSRQNYIRYIMNGVEDKFVLDLVEHIYKEVLENVEFPSIDLPLDHRWLPDATYVVQSSHINRTLLKLFVMVYYNNESKLATMKTSATTLLDYMKSRKTNKVEDKFNNIVVNQFIELVEEFDSSLNILLRQSDLKLTNQDVVEILFLIKWRFVFYKCCLVDIKNNLESNKLITNINVHYHWFFKYAVKNVAKILKRNFNEELNGVLSQINQVVDKQTSGLFKIGSNYQKHSYKPPPYIQRSNLDVVMEYEAICYKYNICDKRNKAETVLRENSNIRNILIDLKTVLTYNFENVTEKIDVLKLTDAKNECLEEQNRYEFELTPFVDYLEQLEIRRGNMDENFIRNSQLVPTDLVGTYLKYISTKDSRLCHELTKIYFIYLIESPSVHLKAYFDQEGEQTVSLSGHHPKLLYYLSTLLMSSESNGMNLTKLGNFRELMKQHRTLNINLWGNVRALHSADYDFTVMEERYIMNDVKTFIEQLSSSLNIDITNSTMKELVGKCTEKIETFAKTITSNEHQERISNFKQILINCTDNRELLKPCRSECIEEKILIISNIHVQLGYLKLVLNSQLHLIDPLTKKSIKKEYCEQAILDFERMKMCYELQNKVYSSSPNTVHELFEPIRDMIEKLAKKALSLGEYVAVRSDTLEYESVLKTINHGMSSILSINSFNKIEEVTTLIQCITSAIKDNTIICTKQAKSTLSQHESSMASYENVILDWSKFRISYPDLVEPLLCNVAQFLYGYKMKISLLRKRILHYEFAKQEIQINEVLVNLVKYPTIDRNQQDYVGHIDNYTGNVTKNFINNALREGELLNGDNYGNFRLLKCGIQDAYNACIIDGKSSQLLNRKIYNKFMELVTKFVVAYNKQELKKEKEENEAESLYRIKTKCQDLPEDKQIEKELKELFPNFHTIDFSDMQTFVQMSDEPELENEEEDSSPQISYEDLKFVTELHVSVVENFTKSEWLNPQKNKNVVCNLIQPLLQKYKIFKQLMDKTVMSLNYTVDKELFGSFSVLLGIVQRYGNEEALDEQVTSPTRMLRNEHRDLYKDSDVEEVKSCYHILEELKTRIEQLLDEWPEQPTLKTITSIIDRIYNFDITSPVSRFLTGFEILLSKCHEWEQVAHSGVSLSIHEQTLTQQIINWRKKELTMWKNLLNSTFIRLNDSKAKWWLYLFGITEQFIVEKLFSVEELITTLQKFITNSNIAEFQSRLDLLFAFHCYAVNFTDKPQREQAQIYHSVLWNVYQYYSQFQTTVVNKIKDLRAPIEKKLKDYVKIVKWKDISYWSVKETVDKTHKILHKHVREFKDVMNEPVAKYLTHTNTSNSKEENVGIWDRPQRHSPKKYHYTMDAANYMAKKSTLKKIEAPSDAILGQETPVLSKIDSYFAKARKLCKCIVETTNYPNLIRDLDEFVGEIIETSSHLQNLEVDTTLPKNKQKSQAKSILQQKHRALADLFKTLSKIGLSYRTGMVDSTVKKNTEEFTIKPVDLKASSNHIGISRNDEKILTIWDSCELYFMRSLIRYDTLQTALLQPAKDLGLNNIQRCQGYSAHLLSLAHTQKIEMIEMSRCLYYLRYYFVNMSRYCNSAEYLDVECLENLKKIMENLVITCNQYKIILNTCPEEDNLNVTPVKLIQLKGSVKGFVQYKYDEKWTRMHSTLNDIIGLTERILTALKKTLGGLPCSEFEVKYPKFVPTDDKELISDQIELILERMKDVLSVFQGTSLFDSLSWLQDQLLNAKEDLNASCLADTSEEKCNLQERIEKSSSKLLLVIQRMFKKYSETPKVTEEIPEEEPSMELQEEHLKNLLVDSLLADVELLNFKKIVKSIGGVFESIISLSLPLKNDQKLVINQYLSLIDQTILLYQYFLTQQVSSYRVTCKLNSVLLNIFIELAGKGFCVPPELSDELDDEGVSKPSDGMGLGDGKGEKDVSDKIESEDQLDEAQAEGKEKENEEDPDCKEEDKGIEMSEDFDSKLQDKEKKDSDAEDNDDNSDSDAEEQMGETGKGADKLDEEIWGSDKEEDAEASEEEGDQEEESGNKGEEEQDKHLGAKEKDSKNKPTDEDEEQPGEDKEKNKKDINELEEPEYDEDQVDPYHGNLPEPPEPEPMELPDDLKLDEGEEKDGEQNEENPFDIDAMKEQNIPENKEETEDEDQKEDKQRDEVDEYSSDDEEVKKGENEEREEQEVEDVDDKQPEDSADDKMKEDSNMDENVEEQEGEDKGDEVEESGLDQTQTNEDRVEAMDVDETEAADKTQGTESESKATQPIEELRQEDKPDQDGMGQSQMEESRSGHSSQTDKPQDMDASKRDNEELKRKQKPGESDTQRSLGDVNEPVQKKLKTIDSKDKETDETEEKEPEVDENAKADMYKHIKDAKEDASQVLDVATEEQAEAQKEKTIPSEKDEETEDPTESSKDLPDEEEENMDISDGVTQKPEKLDNQKDKKMDQKGTPTARS